jgi:hypothetical protein
LAVCQLAIFIGSAMVDHQDGLRDQDIPLDVDTVLGGNLIPESYGYVFINHDNGLAALLRRSVDLDKGILHDYNRIAKLDSVRVAPRKITRVVDRQVLAFGRERVG